MSGFSFIHASDLHLDTPFTGVRSTSAELANRLRDASLEALDRIVERACEIRAAFVVFSGDVYDDAERSTRAQLRFRKALDRLDEAGIRSFIAHGNHDPAEGRWTAIPEWPSSTTVFPAGEVCSVPLSNAEGTYCTVHGISYRQRHETENLALRFQDANGSGFHVGVLHAEVRGVLDEGVYSPCSVGDLHGRGIDYWALGHVHDHKVLSRDPWVVYCGTPQGRSFSSYEQGPKGALEVQVVPSGRLHIKPFNADVVRFFDVEVDIGPLSSLSDLSAAVEEKGAVLVQENPEVLLLLRLTLTGRGAIRSQLSEPQSREDLLQSLREATSLEWLTLRDRTRVPFDYDEILESNDLRAAVIDTWSSWHEVDDLPPRLRDELLKVLSPDILAEELKNLSEGALNDILDLLSD